MNQTLRRLWHASPRSATAAIAGRMGLTGRHRAVHTIGLMFQIDALFHMAGYRLRLLAEHTPSRCLVLADRPGPDLDTPSS